MLQSPVEAGHSEVTLIRGAPPALRFTLPTGSVLSRSAIDPLEEGEYNLTLLDYRGGLL